MIKSINPVEDDKYADSSFTSYQPTYTYAFISGITYPAQGTNRNQRVGDSIRIKKLQVKGQFYGAVTHLARMIIFIWKPISTPTGSEILDSSYAGTFRAPFSPFNFENRSNFKILLDKTHTISESGRQQEYFNYDINMNTVTKFNTGSSTGTNKLYFFWVADGIVTLGTYDLTIRFFFEDE